MQGIWKEKDGEKPADKRVDHHDFHSVFRPLMDSVKVSCPIVLSGIRGHSLSHGDTSLDNEALHLVGRSVDCDGFLKTVDALCLTMVPEAVMPNWAAMGTPMASCFLVSSLFSFQ